MKVVYTLFFKEDIKASDAEDIASDLVEYELQNGLDGGMYPELDHFTKEVHP